MTGPSFVAAVEMAAGAVGGAVAAAAPSPEAVGATGSRSAGVAEPDPMEIGGAVSPMVRKSGPGLAAVETAAGSILAVGIVEPDPAEIELVVTGSTSARVMVEQR